MNSYKTKTLVAAKHNCSTSAPARPMAVGNMHQRGYPSHGMTGRHDSVTSICFASDVYTSSCHKSEETFNHSSSQPLAISSGSCDSERCPFVNWRAMLHTQLWLRPNVTAVLRHQPDPWLSATCTKGATHPTAWQAGTTLSTCTHHLAHL